MDCPAFEGTVSVYPVQVSDPQCRHSTAPGPGRVELLRRTTCIVLSLLLTGNLWRVRHFQNEAAMRNSIFVIKPYKWTVPSLTMPLFAQP